MQQSTEKQITESLHWLFSRSLFIKLGMQEIHHMSIDDIKDLAAHHGLASGDLAHVLFTLCRSMLNREVVTGFVDLLSLCSVLPDNFFHLKEDVQKELLYQAVFTREHHPENTGSRFAFSNPYLICWMPESEAEALESV